MIGKLEGDSSQNDDELQRIKEEENQATNFFLKYNRTTFDLKKKKNCCFIWTEGRSLGDILPIFTWSLAQA